MSLIDKTYFTLDVNVPDGTYSVLTNSIAKYETEILKKAMGHTLYGLLLTETSDRITAIIEGGTYEVDYNGYTHTVNWNGLTNTDLISFIAYYVYYKWQRNNATHTMYTGEIKPTNENSVADSTAMKVQAAWLHLKELYGYPMQDKLEPSLYNFLSENEADYPEWLFSPIESINVFGI